MGITFGAIGLAEPSTITKTVASVIIQRNSTNDHQEILTLGDPQSSLGLARVIAAAPTSTEQGLVVRIASGPSSAADLLVQASGNSTVFQGTSPWVVSPVAGSTWTVRALNSSAADLQMTATPLAGSTWNVRALNSSAADFLVTVSGNSTVAPLAGSTWNTRTLQSSAADLQMTATPASGSTWNTRCLSSSRADFLNTVYQSTASELQMTATQGTNPWTIAGNSTVAPLAGSTWATRPIQSSAADLQMTATPASGSTWNTRCISSSRADFLNTVYQSSASELKASAWNFDGIGNAVESSTRAVGTNSTMRGIAVRSILPALLTTASSNVFASTTFTIATSNAATIQYVYAYSITTTNQTPTMIGFYAGSTLVWPVVLAAISSAMSGVNLAVSPPAYLFAGSTGAVMQLKTDGSTGGGYKAGVSYFVE